MATKRAANSDDKSSLSPVKKHQLEVNTTVILWGPTEDYDMEVIVVPTSKLSKRFQRLLPVVHQHRFDVLRNGEYIDDVDNDDSSSSSQDGDSCSSSSSYDNGQCALDFFTDYLEALSKDEGNRRAVGQPICKPGEIMDACYLIPMVW